MRFATVVMTQTSAAHPVTRLFTADSELSRDAVLRFSVLDDRTGVLLAQIHGDPERVRRSLDATDEILNYSLSEEGEGECLAYVHSVLPDPIVDLVRLRRAHEVVFDFPLEGTGDGGLRLTMVAGSDDVLRQVLAAVPSALSFTIERVGTDPQEAHTPLHVLTDRQRDVLAAAFELGYYRCPREATHRDVAAHLGISVGTVSEHLQKAEARVFEALLG